VATVIWYQVGDQPPNPTYQEASESGVFFIDGRPKPALTAFRFPVVVWRAAGGSMRVWGRAPVSGRLEIQERRRRAWKTVRVLTVGGGSTFTTAIAPFSGAVRGVVAGQASLTWPAR